MPDTALQGFNTGFVDPFQNPGSVYGSGWTFSKGLPGAFSELIGLDQQHRVEEAKLQNDRAYERASINSARAWDEYMDSTQYQRRVHDLEKAGLNPWLAVQNGISGSGTPSSDIGGSAKHQTDSNQSSNALASIVMQIIKLIASS